MIDALPISDTLSPPTQDELVAAVAEAYRARSAIYPVGGGTSLDHGLAAKTPGLALSLARLNRVVDYPARDLTVTVEAGITMAALDALLAAEGQWLPIEVPHTEQATLGGVVATAWCGPRRYGWGQVRDYVIGISAVDGQGLPFKGGGRVVKNVAGYDFCKLLTGSLGTLGVISQITLRTKPRPVHSAMVACRFHDWAFAEKRLAALVTSAVRPAAIELVTGPAWNDLLPAATMPAAGWLLVGLDGSDEQVSWMVDRLHTEWRASGVAKSETIEPAASAAVWQRLTDFAATESALAPSPIVVKASLRPSAVVDFVRLVVEIDPAASVQAHAGTGVVVARFADFPAASISRVLIGRLQPAAVAAGGHLVVLSSSYATELTRQAVWGGATDADTWMRKVKAQFDPENLLNPGRFVY
ncbi:MAG TPA: FAD-binding oxidoreductase [Pirellulales bacterium]|jgi:glycolate oxidase FAD binding subunit|nr:FAD-binding oxidoreductase [Pirellulales bacterium]